MDAGKIIPTCSQNHFCAFRNFCDVLASNIVAHPPSLALLLLQKYAPAPSVPPPPVSSGTG